MGEDYQPGDLNEAAEIFGKGAKLAGQGLKSALGGWKIIGSKLRSTIQGPTVDEKKAAELQKLQDEVTALEAQKKIDAQIAELRKKKQSLTASEESENCENSEMEAFG